MPQSQSLPDGSNPKGGAEQGRQASRPKAKGRASKERNPLIRAENEDDDGYDPYSDRTAGPEPLFERDPWD